MNRLIVLLAISLALISGCRKDSSLPAPAADAASVKSSAASANALPLTMPQSAANQAAIMYKLITMPQLQNSVILWNAGYISPYAISIEGFQVLGNAIKRVYDEAPVKVSAKLFAPADLGQLYLPQGFYYDFNFNLLLGQKNTNAAALYLQGIVITGDRSIPVQLNITDAIALKAQIKSSVERYLSIQAYMATLNFDPGILTRDISADIMRTASVTNGRIIISANSNPQLYLAMVSNLKNNLAVTLQ